MEYGSRESSPSTSVRTVALAVTAGVFLGGVATGVAFPTLPLLDRVLGISAVMLGVILSANRLARLAMNTPAGGFIDSLGARRPMIAGLFVQGLAPFGYVAGLHTPPVELGVLALVGSLAGLVGGIVLIGLGTGGAGSALLATLGDLSPEDDVGKLGGLYNVFGDVGLSLGPLLALPAVESVGFTVTYSVSALVAMACLLLVNATLLATPDT